MSPTEILAKQHYEFSKKIFKNFHIKIDFLTGKTDYKKEKKFSNLKMVKPIFNWYTCFISKKN